MKFNFERILKDKIKLVFISAIIIFPSIEIVQHIVEGMQQGVDLNPNFNTFLSATSRGHAFQIIYFWFLPLYLMVITCEDIIEDKKIGYKDILITKIGKDNYIKGKYLTSFIIGFAIVCTGLLLNYAIISLVFKNGDYVGIDILDSPENFLYTTSCEHPIVANIGFILFTSFIAGLICLVASSIAIYFLKREVIYSIVFGLWFIPLILDNSSMFLMQPFAEYDYDVLISIFIPIFIIYISIIIFIYKWEVDFAEI